MSVFSFPVWWVQIEFFLRDTNEGVAFCGRQPLIWLIDLHLIKFAILRNKGRQDSTIHEGNQYHGTGTAGYHQVFDKCAYHEDEKRVRTMVLYRCQ